MTFNEAETLFKRARNKDKGYLLPGRLGSTRLVKTERGYGIKLHQTVVVEILPKNEYVLNSGGWRTVTTKERINLYSPVRVYSEKRIWYVIPGNKTEFYDGIRIRNGKPVASPKGKQATNRTNQQLARINKFVTKYCKAIDDKTLPMPSGGDCWGCCMVTSSGEVLGDVSMQDHLENHLKENYLVPSLLVNAIKEKGYNPAYVNPWNGFRNDTQTFKRALKDYLVKRLAYGKREAT